MDGQDRRIRDSGGNVGPHSSEVGGGARRRPLRKGHAVPGVGRHPVVVADEETAHPTHGVRERQRRSRRIEHHRHVQLTATDEQIEYGDPAEEPAVPHQPPAAQQRPHRVRRHLLPVQRHVVELRPENPAQRHPRKPVPREVRIQPPSLQLGGDHHRSRQERQRHEEPEARDLKTAPLEQNRVHVTLPEFPIIDLGSAKDVKNRRLCQRQSLSASTGDRGLGIWDWGSCPGSGKRLGSGSSRLDAEAGVFGPPLLEPSHPNPYSLIPNPTGIPPLATFPSILIFGCKDI